MMLTGCTRRTSHHKPSTPPDHTCWTWVPTSNHSAAAPPPPKSSNAPQVQMGLTATKPMPPQLFHKDSVPWSDDRPNVASSVPTRQHTTAMLQTDTKMPCQQKGNRATDTSTPSLPTSTKQPHGRAAHAQQVKTRQDKPTPGRQCPGLHVLGEVFTTTVQDTCRCDTGRLHPRSLCS